MFIPENKKWENLTLSNDFIFCRVMKVKELCRELIEILLNVKIKEINYIEDQKTINVDHETKGIRLDIVLEGDDKIYNIEMQTRETKEIPRRIRYCESLIDINSLEKGNSYRNLKDTIIIFICNFDMFKKNLPRYDFKTYCTQDKTIELDKGITEIFFNTKAYGNATDENLKAFLKFLESNENEKNNEFVGKLENMVMKIKNNRKEEKDYMNTILKEQLAREEGFEEGVQEGRREGIEIGEQRGIEIGEQRGIEIGEQRGRKEGRKEGIEIGEINATIKLCREFGFEEDKIMMKLINDFNLTEEKAKEYLDRKTS